MIAEIWNLFTERPEFWVELILQHLRITVTAILIATVLGLAVGVLASENRKSSAVYFRNCQYCIYYSFDCFSWIPHTIDRHR